MYTAVHEDCPYICPRRIGDARDQHRGLRILHKDAVAYVQARIDDQQDNEDDEDVGDDYEDEEDEEVVGDSEEEEEGGLDGRTATDASQTPSDKETTQSITIRKQRARTPNADAETDAADGVEGQAAALQSPIPPPGLNKSKRKRKSKHERPNNRTCLLESVLALVPTETKELVRTVLLTAMPAAGDTSVAGIANALAAHGLSLVPVNSEYRKKGGIEFNLLQERQCKLVINLRLTNRDGDAMSHFVAFDGECIHDRPYLSKVNSTYDRTNPEKNKLAFGKLFKKPEFQSWQITSVYRLCQSHKHCVG
jgi:hypothetical protein